MYSVAETLLLKKKYQKWKCNMTKRNTQQIIAFISFAKCPSQITYFMESREMDFVQIPDIIRVSLFQEQSYNCVIMTQWKSVFSNIAFSPLK